MIGAFSGSSMLGIALSSTSNHLWLEFFSDQEDTAEGFKLNYSSKDSDFFFIPGQIWEGFLIPIQEFWLLFFPLLPSGSSNTLVLWETLLSQLRNFLTNHHQDSDSAWINSALLTENNSRPENVLCVMRDNGVQRGRRDEFLSHLLVTPALPQSLTSISHNGKYNPS